MTPNSDAHYNRLTSQHQRRIDAEEMRESWIAARATDLLQGDSLKATRHDRKSYLLDLSSVADTLNEGFGSDMGTLIELIQLAQTGKHAEAGAQLALLVTEAASKTVVDHEDDLIRSIKDAAAGG